MTPRNNGFEPAVPDAASRCAGVYNVPPRYRYRCGLSEGHPGDCGPAERIDVEQIIQGAKMDFMAGDWRHLEGLLRHWLTTDVAVPTNATAAQIATRILDYLTLTRRVAGSDRAVERIAEIIAPHVAALAAPSPAPQQADDEKHDGAAPKSVTRFEVIDASGRVLARHDIKAELSYQDDGRTLKVFLTDRGNTDASEQHHRELAADLGKLRTLVGSHGMQVLSDSEPVGTERSAEEEIHKLRASLLTAQQEIEQLKKKDNDFGAIAHPSNNSFADAETLPRLNFCPTCGTALGED